MQNLKINEPRFIHLRIHSDYSMIDGLAKVEMLVRKATELGMPALAITDFTNLCGLIKFYETAHSNGLKPIIGADFYMKSELFNNEITQITILAMNNIGYRNLILLISKAYQQGYGKLGPWINRNWLIEQNEGLLLLSGGRMGDIGICLLRGNNILANKCIDFYQRYLPNRFYLEIIRTGRTNEENYLNAAITFAKKRNLPLVATNDVRFIDSSDFNAHEVRVAIHNGLILNDIKHSKNYSPQQYMRSEEEMWQLFNDIPEALENSVQIAKRCNVTIRLGEYFLPQFPTGNMSTEDFLIKKSKEGLEERLNFLFPSENERKKNRFEYDERLDFELKVINHMGFPGYFLIVMEFIQWSKDNNVPVGPGRGSGAGSLVAYSLRITDLNPIEFNLLFERFLNPERISMPDFDIDFCMEKRDQVIEHVSNIYGREAVSQIIAFGTMTAKAVIRDVGRVLGYSYNFVNRISKLIPSDPGMTLEKAFKIEPKLLEVCKSDEEIRLLINMARKLEGVIRNVSKHAGGVVISPTKITDFVPIYCDENGQYPVTQFDKNDIEHAGLVKFDFLGLRTLTIINWTLKMINKRRKKNNELLLDITTIPLDDKKSFKKLQRSETIAIFQLESRGMRELIKRLQPDCFEDIIALIALFRPGPLQSGMVENFINRKHGREKIYYPDIRWQHKSLKSVLESTYGIILYQEQVMQIAKVLAGYSFGDADILRRAMGKKKPEEMIKQRFIFEEGAKRNGISGELAVKIFDLVEKFAGYGFNKSHSAAYALVSYQTLWLKTHYPAEFMAATMTADINNTDKIADLVDECWRMGLKILPPDINSGLYNFHVNEDNEIVYGIGAIKGIGENQIKAIIEERNKNGNFHEFFDFCMRVNNKINRRALEKLIMSGALDKLGLHRAALINSLDNTLKAVDQYIKSESTGQIDMFSKILMEDPQTKQSHVNYQKWSRQVLLNSEHEALGLYLTDHKINQYLKEIEYYVGNIRLKDIYPKDNGKIITVAGLVINLRSKITKNGNRIGICLIDDRSSRLEVILFSSTLDKYQKILKKNQVFIFSGKINFINFSKDPKMTAYKIISIDSARNKYVRRLAIYLKDNQTSDQFFNQLHRCLNSYSSGTIPVCLYYQKINRSTKLRLDVTWRITINDYLLNELHNLVGSEQVKLEFD